MGDFGTITEAAVALALIGGLVAASYFYRRSILEAFALAWHTRGSLVLLAVAAVLYGAAQTREVLWIDYGDAIESILASLDPARIGDSDYPRYFMFVRLLWQTLYSASTISILVLAFCFAAINPDLHRSIWRRQGDDGLNRDVALSSGFIASYLFLAIVFYNILVAAKIPPLDTVEWASFAINVALAALVVVLPVGLLIVLINAESRAAAATAAPAPPPQARGAQAATMIGSALCVAPFAAALLVAFALCALALGLLLLSAPLKLIGLDVTPFFADVIVILNLFVGALMVLVSALNWLRSRDKLGENEKVRSVGPAALVGWPVLGILILVGLALSYFNLNDNHQIARLGSVDAPNGAAGCKPAMSLTEAYEKWIASPERQFDKPRPGPYPVYVVAAEGGGIYAAYHAALTLAAIQDRYPDFARHVFAISSVSGGSLGASIFASLLASSDAQPPERWFWSRAGTVLGSDFLSPLTFAALFTDLPAALMPCVGSFCPGRTLDRARALEGSFIAAWRKAFPDGANADRLERSATAWSADGAVPALVLNATEVETGERVVIAPFAVRDPNAPALVSLTERNACLDVSLATATGLSARFPLLTPAGWYDIERKPAASSTSAAQVAKPDNLLDVGLSHTERPKDGPVRRQLVDGAYYDNSGITTALDIILALQRIEREHAPQGGRVRFILIAIKTIGEGADESVQSAFSELLAPVQAINSVRAGRAESALLQASAILDGDACASDTRSCPAVERAELNCASNPAFCSAGPALRIAPLVAAERLPLGWMLSAKSKSAIEANDDLDWCVADRFAIIDRQMPATMTPPEAAARKCRLLGRIGDEIGAFSAAPAGGTAR